MVMDRPIVSPMDSDLAMDSVGAVCDEKDGVPKKKKIKAGSFQGLGLSHATHKAVMRMGYKMPTPIQRKTIPTIMEGQDMVAMARTGSGKTAAFLIPICERLDAHSVAVGVRAVVLSPTRELAMQTAKFFRQLGKFKGLRCTLLVGGQAMETQFEHLASNPDVVVATPGRLMHHMLEADLSLSRVDMLVFDECDRLFELGFAEQLHKIIEGCPQTRQVLLFSATLPAQLISFTRAGLKNPAMVRLDVETTLSEQLELQFLYTRKDEKLAVTISLLRRLHQKGKSTVMFVATKHHVEFFGELLQELGLTVAIVYGSMDQEAREEQVYRFRSHRAGILVTTDVAARGIDIPLLDHVVNFDFPPSSKLFVHRCGRTARAGRSGLAVSMLTLEDLPYTVELMLFLGIKLSVATGRPAERSFQPGDSPVIGAIPSVQLEVETLSRLLPDQKHDQGSHLISLFKSMNASYHLYNRTRPSASKSSMARARELLEECGGPARLQGLVHPEFCAEDGQVDSRGTEKAVGEQVLLQTLRGFRPKIQKVGNVISVESMKFMGQSKKEANIVSEVKKAANESNGMAKRIEDVLNEGQGRKASEDNARKRSHQETSESQLASRDKPRLSKKARKKLPTGSSQKNLDDFDDFDVQVDGVDVNSAAEASASGQAKPEQFFLSVERNQDEEAKERGLDMEQYQIDLCPDEGSALQTQKSVIKWDAKKKKYLPVMVAADGRVVKQKARRNESGVYIKEGEGEEKSGSYVKWAKSTKKRIQKVGELENENQGVPIGQKARHRLAMQQKARTVEFGDEEAAGEATGSQGDTSKRKPVVPFYGEIDEKHLTHKQKRMQGKRDKKDQGGVTYGDADAKSEIRSAVEIVTEKRAREQNKVKQNPKLRMGLAKAAKDKRRTMHEGRQMKYGARTKSQMMIFEGAKRGGVHANRKDKKKRRGHQFSAGGGI